MTERSKRIRTLGLATGLALLVGFVYGQTLRFEFLTYDDDVHVWQNPYVLEGLTARSVVWACTATTINNWHPVTSLSFLVDAELTRALEPPPLDGTPEADPTRAALRPLSPRVFHATNVVLQFAATLLLWAFLERSTGQRVPSVLAAAIFAVHPLNVESVAWITERKELLSTCGGLLALLAFHAWVVRGSRRAYAGALLALTFALMSKPMLVTLPFLLLVLDFWPWRRVASGPSATEASGVQRSPAEYGADSRNAAGRCDGSDPPPAPPAGLRRRLVEKLPFFGLAVAFCVIALVTQTSAREAVRTDQLSFGRRVENAVQATVEYAEHFVWPRDLCVLYPHLADRLTLGRTLLAIGLLLAVTVLLGVCARRAPAALVGWLWFLGSLVPVVGLVQVGSQRMADRYMHWPGIGLTIALAWIACELRDRWARPAARAAVAGILVALVCLLAIQARRQARTWRDGVVLFEHALQVTDQNPIAEAKLADSYVHRGFPGDLQRARRHYEAAVRLDPSFLAARIRLATLLCRTGDITLGERQLARLVTENPSHAEARFNWGAAQALLGDWEAAEQSITRARELGANPRACQHLLEQIAEIRKTHGAAPPPQPTEN